MNQNASAEEIHSAYKKRVKVLHPDRFNKETQPTEWQMANDMLRELNEAYAELKRAQELDDSRNDSVSDTYHESEEYEAQRRAFFRGFQDPDNPRPDELMQWVNWYSEMERLREEIQQSAARRKWAESRAKEFYFNLKFGISLFLIGVAGMVIICWTIDPGTLPKGEWCWQKVVFWSDVGLMGIGLLFIYGFYTGA